MIGDEKEILKYVAQHSTAQDDVLTRLERKTNLYSTQPRMLSGQIQGKFLQFIVDMLSPMSVAEIGTFTGYSAICIARALKDGAHLHTIDINDELRYIAEGAIEDAGVSEKVTLHTGSAIDVLPTLNIVFDLIFVDGDKREYPEYFTMIMDGGYVKKGSYILADNTLWDGKVVDLSPKNLKDSYTQGILKFNKMVAEDSRVEVIMMPFRDGMSIIRVK
ncbi:MAG: class I SAM-dependent methyltransferase [Rikenellaceae bacterium]